MIVKYRALDQFLQRHGQPKMKGKNENEGRTLMVNLLYGNSRGMRLKKLSSYSFSRIALSATCANNGFIVGGNLPFTPHDSILKKSTTSHQRSFALA